MANPASGSTPTYHLRWPGGPDPAEGPTGFQNLANDTEAALTPIDARSKNPQLIWARFNLGAGTILSTGAQLILPITLTSQGGTSWSTASSTNLACNAAGAGLYGFIGTLRCTNSGAITVGGYLQTVVATPPGTFVVDRITPLYGTSWVDVPISGSFRIAAGANLNVVVSNNASGQNENMTAGNGFMWRVGD